MLKQRVITALVLVAILLPCLLLESPWPFAVLTLVFIGAAGWEWARLNGGHGVAAVALGGVIAAGGAIALVGGWLDAPRAPAIVGPLAALGWVLGGALVLRRGGAGWAAWPVALRWLIGMVVLWLAWAAMTRAKLIGLNFLLSVFCLVWAADIAAYFGGRRFGRRKLAPAISPGKSWEGVWSGLVGTWGLAALWMALEQQFVFDSPSLYTLLLRQFGALGLLVSLSFLAAMSVVGDLFESLVKRQAGAKDSSRLLPGHGGVLDRIDALLPVFPLALYLVSLGA
ncbi:MAG: phosphatidate cytidylyltransferase [Pseudomonadota bacterium]